MTSHLRQRYYERILNEGWGGISKVDSKIMSLFYKSKENKKWVNNTYMMEYFREKYNSTKMKIFIEPETNTVFVCKRDERIVELYYIVTCFLAEKESMYLS